jgi:hypothetical protein
MKTEDEGVRAIFEDMRSILRHHREESGIGRQIVRHWVLALGSPSEEQPASQQAGKESFPFPFHVPLLPFPFLCFPFSCSLTNHTAPLVSQSSHPSYEPPQKSDSVPLICDMAATVLPLTPQLEVMYRFLRRG